jgi:hypothetical protein
MCGSRELRGRAARVGRGHRLDRDAESSARRSGGRAAEAGKHFVLEKPTGLDVAELVRIRDAVRRAGVRTIVSFVLRYNPF